MADAPASLAATATAAAPRRRLHRALRAALWSLAALVLLVAVVLALGWWWIGSNQSLAYALAQAARYLPAGQTLSSRDVSGSLRTGGRIGWLRWESETLAVEAHQVDIGWELRPLLRKRVQLGAVHVRELHVARRGPPGPDTPPEPLQSLVLPVEVELPLRVDTLRFDGPPALAATGLAGRYVYEGGRHAVTLDGVDIAEGHYSGQVALDGTAPMAIDARLDGRVRAPLPEDRAMTVLASARVKGELAGIDAQLTLEADVRPADEDAAAEAPMRARLRGRVAPWHTQPVIDAQAELQNVDAAALWPGAPATRLSGRVDAGPHDNAGAGHWQAQAALENASPGPWDEGRLPVRHLNARVETDGHAWSLPQVSVQAGGGRIEGAGDWRPAPAPWQLALTLRGVRPGELHTALAGAPVSGRAQATQDDDGGPIRFDLALQAQGGAGASGVPEGLRLERAQARGLWRQEEQLLDLASLRIEAARAQLDGKLQARVAAQSAQGALQLVLPGGRVQVDGRIAPAQGGGTVQARVDDAAAVQAWLGGLPGLDAAASGVSAQGAASLDARWSGGWQTVRDRLREPNRPLPRGSTEPTLNARLESRRLDLKLPASSGPAPNATPPAAPVTWQVRELLAVLDGSLAQASLSLRGQASDGIRRATLDTRATGGLQAAGTWRASVASLKADYRDEAAAGNPWSLELARALDATVRLNGDRVLEVEGSGGGATLRGPVPGTVRFEWEPLRLRRQGQGEQAVYRLQSKGRMQGLPMAWNRAFGGNASLDELGISGDLVFDGEWDIEAAERLRAHARLARASGDLRVQAGEASLVRRIESRGTGTRAEIKTDAAESGPATPAGLRQAELRLDAEGDTVRATLGWDSERAGQIRAEASTRVAQRGGGWQWAADAPLSGQVKARLPQLGVWSMLAPPGWRLAGSLEADATLAGSRDAPRWNGTLAADQLALLAKVEGLDLRDGRLRATLTGQRMEITEFTLKGGPGSRVRITGQGGNRSTVASEAATDGGMVSAKGSIGWGASGAGSGTGTGIHMAMQAQIRSLRALVRTDRQVTVSGDLQAGLEQGRLQVRGTVRTDRAVIILPDETAPSLGGDVVVHSAAKARQAAEDAAREAQAAQAARDEPRPQQPRTLRAPDIQVRFDLGDDFAVQGRGIKTRLEGQLDIRATDLSAPPRITGEVKTVRGQYRAYGQQLDVESGVARFSGPFDNPALDILALRPNLTQRAGVRITGSAQSPRVRLYSEPALSDAETLSWIVLGRASATSGGEALLMQQAALALLGGLGHGDTGGSLASRFGLDEIGFKGPGDGGDVRNSAITVGKRLSNDFYVTYERSLAGTLGTLFIFYDLTRRLTLRGQAGVQSGLDLIYTVQYD